MPRKSKPKPEQPTSTLVDRYYKQFEHDDRYALGDRALLRLFKLWPDNTDVEQILIKVCALNDLYSTQIYATVVMAKHILDLNIDPLIKSGDPSAVDRIADAPIGDNGRNCFSFATKYCSWHDQDHYPIYDKYVHGMLVAYMKHYGFTQFTANKLREYDYFKSVVETFRSHFDLSQYSLKQLDKFLWLYGKELDIA